MKSISIAYQALGTVFIFGVLGCGKSDSLSLQNNNTGVGGSMARFTISGDHLYAVDNTTLKAFDISNPADPQLSQSTTIANDLETIFPYGDYLLMGSQSGMYIYQQMSTTATSSVQEVGSVEHFFSCDPVVAQNDYAYVTLRREGPCGWSQSLLQTYDIHNISQPTLVDEQTISEPSGLGVDGNLLFVCGGGAIVVYDVSNPALPTYFSTLNVDAYDVIPLGTILIVVGPQDVYQYDYSDPQNIHFLSSIHYGV